MAAMGVCVAVNQIISDTSGGQKLNDIAERHTVLSNRSRAAVDTSKPDGEKLSDNPA
jgi:hypothetical protein